MGRRLAALVLFALVLPFAPGAEAGTAPQRFLVSFAGDVPLVGDTLAGARVLERFPFAGVALLEAPSAAALLRLPQVAGVYPEEPIALAMDREREIVAADAPPGADWPTGAGITVALVDSGIDSSHPAFADRVSASVRISRAGIVSADAGDADGHGTHVAGIVAGDGAKSTHARHHGIAPSAKLVGIDISDSFTTTNAVRAFAWIHDNAGRYDIRVVSNSWGREKESAHYDVDDPVIRASDALIADGIVVVFSAGNRGRDGSATLTSEASNPNVITVGAANAAGRAEGYSSRGPPVDGEGRALTWTKPDVVAPGTAVVSTRASVLAAPDARTDEERYYTTMNGTSMAAPQVAAAVALLLQRDPSLTPADVQLLLQRSASDVGAPGADADTGYGMLDVAAALAAVNVRAGGEERVIVERMIPVRHAGSVTAALGQVVLLDNAPRLPPAAALVVPLVLPPGAAAVELWFNWTAEGTFAARLVGPSVVVPFESVGGKSLHVATGLAPGAWRVEATPTGMASATPYTLAGAFLVREEKIVEVAAEQHGRPLAGRSTFAPSAASDLVSLKTVSAAPLLVLAIAATAAVGIALTRKKR